MILRTSGSAWNSTYAPFFGDKPLAKVTTFDVERYKKHRLEEKAANGTINRELAALSHLFTKAVQWRWIGHKPVTIKRLEEDKGRITYLTNDQIERLLDAAMQDEFPHIYPYSSSQSRCQRATDHQLSRRVPEKLCGGRRCRSGMALSIRQVQYRACDEHRETLEAGG